VSEVKKIMVNQKLSSLPNKRTPNGSADYYSYKISIQDGGNQRVIECNEYNIQGNLRHLVKYIEENSNFAK
jgi:Emfourin